MKLENIAKMYGMNDYFDMNTGYTYHLSRAKDNRDGTLSIPVSCVHNQFGTTQIIGFATMEKVNV